MQLGRTAARTGLITLTALAALSSAVPASAASWGSIHTLSGNGKADSSRSMLVQGASAWITYVDDAGVEVRRSTDGGATWGAKRTLEKGGPKVYLTAPQLAVSGSHVIVLYLRERNQLQDVQWLVRRSSDAGQTWAHSAPVITVDPSDAPPSVTLGSTGSDAVIGWTNETNGDIKIRRSADAGAHWQASHSIGTTNLNGSWYEGDVHVAAAGGHIYVAWVPDATIEGMGTGITMRRSDDGGKTFAARTWLTADALRFHGDMTIAASGDRLLAVYERAAGQLAGARSSDAGKTMHTDDITHSLTEGSHAIALLGSKARLVIANANGTISLRSSSDQGAHWSGATPVTKSISGNYVAGLSVGLGTKGTQVTWEDVDDAPFPGTIFARHQG